MIRRVRATASEGLPALWKGQVVATLHGVLSTLLQPRIHSLVFSAVPSSGAPLPLDFPLTALPHPGVPLVLQVTSHALTQFLLSPLELIKTRLIVSPGSLPSTPSSVTLLRRAIRDEGGFTGLYLAPNVLIPTVLEVVLKPLLSLSIPLVLERQFGISPEISPLTYALAEVALNIGSLLLILPIETVRKRLQLQSRASGGKKTRSVVRLRERDYVGVVEAIWRIITEETAAPRKRRMTEKDEGGMFSGICQLYRGVSLGSWSGHEPDTDSFSLAWPSARTSPSLPCSSSRPASAAAAGTTRDGRRFNCMSICMLGAHPSNLQCYVVHCCVAALAETSRMRPSTRGHTIATLSSMLRSSAFCRVSSGAMAARGVSASPCLLRRSSSPSQRSTELMCS